jgi:hypothetical protein
VNFARWRFPVSIRHDLVIPGLLVVGLWFVAAWYYADNTYAGGVVATPDQAIAAMKQYCGKLAPPGLLKHPFAARLNNGAWFVSADLREYPWSRPDAIFSGIVEARTGEVPTCRMIAID